MHTLTKKNFELKKVNFNIMHTRSKKSPPRSGYLYCLDLCNTRLTAPRKLRFSGTLCSNWHVLAVLHELKVCFRGSRRSCGRLPDKLFYCLNTPVVTVATNKINSSFQPSWDRYQKLFMILWIIPSRRPGILDHTLNLQIISLWSGGKWGMRSSRNEIDNWGHLRDNS